jgi:hypothetical protein
MVRLDNFNKINDVYQAIKSRVAEEFETTYHPSHINIPVDIEVKGQATLVYFNIAMYQSKTGNDIVNDIADSVSYIHDVTVMAHTQRYGELVLLLFDDET